jgi:23S rRNA (uracil1939-C5)-methyltransferase
VAAPSTPLRVTGIAVGGDGVAREPDGRVVFVEGALPGELVAVEIEDEHRRHARGRVADIVEPAAARVPPPCPRVAEGCGGCGWQHVEPAAQAALKRTLVSEALDRLGGIADADVAAGPPLPTTGYRTTLRGLADGDGRFCLRRHHSHDLVPVPGCLVAHPLVVEIVTDGRFPPGAEVMVRVGAHTGERMVVVDGDAAVDVDDVDVPPGVRVVTGAALAAGRRAWLHEEVHGVRLRVSARSFFQAGADAAEALVTAVAGALGDVREGERLADLYGGVGLFAATLGRRAHLELVEGAPAATADARVNLAELDARVLQGDVGRWRPRRMDAVVADPPRAGLGPGGVRAVAGTRAARLALVSCDAASLGRDARLLADAGYRFGGATVLDVFPHTPHVEVVAAFERR